MIFGVYRVTENILLYFIHLLFEIDENQFSAEFIYVGALTLEPYVIRCHCAPVNSHTLHQRHSQERPSFLAHLVHFLLHFATVLKMCLESRLLFSPEI